MNITSREINALQKRREVFKQSENADLDYVVNWSAVLDTDTISTSSWSSTPSLTISNETNTNKKPSAIITGNVGEYIVVNKIVTAAGITDERKFRLFIQDNEYPLDAVEDYGFVR